MITYWIYKQRNIPYTSFNWVHLNWFYDLSFFLSYQEYQNTLLKSVQDGDNLIPSHKLKNDYRLFIAENNMSNEQIEEFVSLIPSEFWVQILDNNQAKEWLRRNTDLQEVETGKFLISEATTGIQWQPIEAVYLVID